MRQSPHADARSLQRNSPGHSTLTGQTVFLVALLLAGLVISFFVVRYIDPPKAVPAKAGAATIPQSPAAWQIGAWTA